MQADIEGRGGFLFNVNLVFLSQILIYGLAFGLRVVLARGLGDSGLGTYSLFFVAVLVAGGLANLGVGLGNIYFLNKGTYSYGVLLSGSLFVLVATSAVAGAFVLAWGLAYQPELFVTGRAFWLYAAALPAVVGYVLLTSFLHGSSRFVALSAVAIAQGCVGFGAVAVLEALGRLDIFWAIAAWAGSFAAADILALTLVRLREADLGALLPPRWEVLREQVRYGAQGQLANLAQLFNYRLDQFLVAAFVSRAGVGHYTVAVGLGESVWWISSAVAMVLLPRLTRMESEEAAEKTPLICRNTLLVSAVAALALMAVSPLAIRVLFGADFKPATLPLVLLMPGIVAGSATRVLGSYLFSQGRILYNTYATFIALGLTLALDFALIPRLEVEGAAIASSVAYTASLIATLYWYRRVSGGSIREALIFQRGDVRFYADVVQRLRRRWPA
ncbi:MAG: polysaccharide biosynthesis C-terminal domain-containing protein [Dehalococcoidia bacterium]|nr:polysaccharide biosynthesis C-terminal domain-containing protein [Dehalococcoidia bacterium]